MHPIENASCVIVTYQALFTRGVRRVRPRVGKSLSAVFAFEGFFSGVNPLVLFQMMLELESFSAGAAFEFPQLGIIVMIGHVSLELR